MTLRNTPSSYGSVARAFHWGMALLVVVAIVPPPAAWQRKAAHAVEWTFYALMVALPVLGILMLQADGRPVALLGLPLPVVVGVDKTLAHRLEDVHEWLGNAMLALIGLHVAATVWHGVVLRDNTLARMR